MSTQTILTIAACLYLIVGCGALVFMLESRPESSVPTPRWYECIGMVLLAPPLILWSVLKGERV